MGYETMLAQMKKNYVEYTLEQEDGPVNNHTYKDEQELLDLVRRGESETVRIAVDTMMPPYPDVIGYSAKKNEEYMAVVMITLVSRAVIEAGITSAESFALADVYLKKNRLCPRRRSRNPNPQLYDHCLYGSGGRPESEKEIRHVYP